MRTKNKIAVALFYFLLAALTVSEAKETSNSSISAASSPYPIYDSETWADPLRDPEIYWIDNNRILFKTVKGNDKHRVTSGPFNLSIWDTTTRKVTAYTEYANSLTVCYREGFIYYAVADEPFHVQQKKWRRFAGVFGKEKSFTSPTKDKSEIRNPMSCRSIDDPKLASLATKRSQIKLLLERHGYLDYGPRDAVRPLGKKGDPILFYRTGKKEPVSLSITNEGIRHADYYPFKGAYFIHPFISNQDTWWLYPEGRMEEIKFPALPKLLAYGKFYPISKGFFITADSSKIDTGKDPGDAGGYLLTGTSVRKLIAGYLRAETVSPDGCKIAFVSYPYIDATLVADPAPITLKMIDFCMEEK